MRVRLSLAVALAALMACSAFAEDWPAYRHDNARSAVTKESLGPQLNAQWVFTPPHPPEPAWPGEQKEKPRVRFDEAYHVAAAGDAVFFGTSSDNSVYCLDAATGELRWSVILGGPIRVAPAVDAGRVYVGSDDGYVYCLDAKDGAELWRVRAAHRPDQLIGNGRMISMWPVRTGVLIENGIAYFGAGVFPHEGLFLCAVKADDGTILWRNDSYGDEGYKLDYGGLSPQGPLLASRDKLFVPSGRAVPAAFNKNDGAFITFMPAGHSGGTWAMLTDDRLVAGVDGKLAFDADKAKPEKDPAYAWYPGLDLVVDGNNVYVSTWDDLLALDRSRFAEAEQRHADASADQRKVQSRIDGIAARLKAAADTEKPALQKEQQDLEQQAQALQGQMNEQVTSVTRWKRPCLQHNTMALAGQTLFLGGDDALASADPSTGAELWKAPVNGRVCGLAVANGRLFASLDIGAILCFAPQQATPRETRLAVAPPAPEQQDSGIGHAAEQILKASGVSQGFCLVYGCGTGRLAMELAQRSELLIVGVDPDAQRVAEARTLLTAAGLYGTRVTVQQGEFGKLPYANYFANLIVSERILASGKPEGVPAELQRMLKPCGGALCLGGGDFEAAAARDWLALSPEFTPELGEHFIKVTRGPLPGAGKWTHQYADPGNTACSDEMRVKGALGVLWYGLPGPEKMVERHARAAAPLAMDGRLFIQGEHTIMAYDSYNGLKLWERAIPGAVRVRVDSDMGNLAMSADGLFVAAMDKCIKLDPATGEILNTFALPDTSGKARRWGYIACVGDTLYGSVAAPLSEEYGQAWDDLVDDDGTWADFETIERQRALSAEQRNELKRMLADNPAPDGKAFWDAQHSGFFWRAMTAWPAWGSVKAPVGAVTERIMASTTLFALDAKTGALRWRSDGKAIAHPAIAIGDGMLYFADCAATDEQKHRAMEERNALIQRGVWEKEGIEYGPEDADVRVVTALDAATGEKRWERIMDLTGCGGDRMGAAYKDGILCFLGCFSNHDRDLFKKGDLAWRRITAVSGKDGADLWSRPLNYLRRPVVVGDKILIEPRACGLRDGVVQTRLHPLTDAESTWEYVRPGHCCSATSACPNMFFLRGYFLWYYDLNRDQGMLPFGGIRPGCWINTIPANGLVLFPEADAACTCSYPIRATVALEPKEEFHTYSLCVQNGPMTPVKHLAVNFGAPGDWRDADGTLWFAYPHPPSTQWYKYGVGFDLEEQFSGSKAYFSRDFQGMDLKAAGRPWVFASGARGMKSFSLPLLGDGDSPGTYTVRLYFADTENSKPKHRVFAVKLQGETCVKNLDIVREAGQNTGLVKEFRGVKVVKALLVELEARNDTANANEAPIINGIEAIREN